MKNAEQDTDLEFLAALGQLAHGGAQPVPSSLQRRWKARFAKSNLRINVGIAFLSLLVIGLIFLYNKQTEPLAGTKKIESPTIISHEAETINVPQVDVVPEELFERAQPKKSPVTVEQKSELPVAEEMQALPMAQLPNLSVQEDKLKFMINTPLYYIHDLKVSNYQLLYFKKNKFVPALGVPADKISKEEMRLKEAPDQWLHLLLAEALLNYRKAEYFQCVQKLNEVGTFNTEDVNCDFYRGMSWYHMKHYDKAIVFLTKCIEASNNAFLQEAQYYKALALEQNGDNEAAQLLFKKIVADGEFYAEKAKLQLK